MKEKLYLGVDPGESGAFCLADYRGDIVEIFDMPFIHAKGVDSIAVLEWLHAKMKNYELSCGFELCQSTPKMSSKGAFSFGRNIQAVETILICLKIPVMFHRPQEWQKHFSLINKNKLDNCVMACEMQPYWREKFIYTYRGRQAIKDGRADAYLIAEYTRRKCNGIAQK